MYLGRESTSLRRTSQFTRNSLRANLIDLGRPAARDIEIYCARSSEAVSKPRIGPFGTYDAISHHFASFHANASLYKCLTVPNLHPSLTARLLQYRLCPNPKAPHTHVRLTTFPGVSTTNFGKFAQHA